MTTSLTHIDDAGRPSMVDVSDKAVTAREAVAQGAVSMSATAFALALGGDNKKGDVRATAQIAGIMAGKKTSDLIPLCHSLPLSSLKVEIEPDAKSHALIVTARAKTTGQTGVEMEALTAVSIACLTIYDMLKAVDKGMVIGDISLREKTGGKSGHYIAPEVSLSERRNDGEKRNT
jgi:cyclic pyranopterin monophosphate synthase